MDPQQIAILVGVAFAALMFLGLGFMALYAKLYRKVDQGKALIVSKKSDVHVMFTGGLVIPIIHRAEEMDISVKTIDISRTGKDGLICQDNIRADIRVTFFVRVNKTAQDVLKVAQSIGTRRASDQQTLEQLFVAKFAEALKTVGKGLDFEALYTQRDKFKNDILRNIGEDLNGYVLDDAAIDFLEQTPLVSLDKDNILDAQGIRKITQITAEQAVHTNDLRREEEKAIKKQDVEAKEAILELERQQADAEAKQAREIASVKAREEAETQRVWAEERRKAELARIKLEEDVAVSDQNKHRTVEVAQKNRERAVAVEHERVMKDQQLEAISRERETELKRIAKEKALEIEKKEIEEVIRARIVVHKTRVEEEERIKDVQVVAAAKRSKEAKIIDAQAEAEELLVKDIKQAEAQEVAAKHKAKETLTLAEADLEAADKQARAKIRLAEGLQAEKAAGGLAEVRVKEADAAATEKMGDAKARVTKNQMSAEAEGREAQGLALVRVKEAEAEAIEKTGRAEAAAVREKLLAEASGKEADAVATEKMGQAKAVELREKLLAEAQGIEQKAQAMKLFDPETRAHEEFRIRLEKEIEVQLERIGASKAIAHEQAKVLAEAMASAKINIVGGDGQFFERFINAVSMGQALDGVVHNSETTNKLMADYLGGQRSLPEDLKDILSRPNLDSETIKNLSVSAALTQIMSKLDDGQKPKVQTLLSRAKELGLE